MEFSRKNVDASGKRLGLGRCRHFFWLGVVFDTVGAAVLLTGVFADLLFYDMLLYLGSIIIFISLLWWISWYTGNIELLPDDDVAAVPVRAAATASGQHATATPPTTTAVAAMPTPLPPLGRRTSGPLGGVPVSFLPLRGRRRVRRVVQRAARPGPDDGGGGGGGGGGHPRGSAPEKPEPSESQDGGGGVRPTPGLAQPVVPLSPLTVPVAWESWTTLAPGASASQVLGSETSDGCWESPSREAVAAAAAAAAAACHPHPLVRVDSHRRLPGPEPAPEPPVASAASQSDLQVPRSSQQREARGSPFLNVTTMEPQMSPSIADFQAVFQIHRSSQNIPLFQDAPQRLYPHGMGASDIKVSRSFDTVSVVHQEIIGQQPGNSEASVSEATHRDATEAAAQKRRPSK